MVSPAGAAPHAGTILQHSALRSARLPVNLIGSPIYYANRLIGSPITSQSTAAGARPLGQRPVRTGGTAHLVDLLDRILQSCRLQVEDLAAHDVVWERDLPEVHPESVSLPWVTDYALHGGARG